MMRAIQASEFGPPDVLVPSELPEPTAGPGQVVVDVRFAPVLFLDTQIRAGWGRDWFPVTPPYTPGAGVAGEVISVGAGVSPEWAGRRVVADAAEGGGYCERAAVEAGELSQSRKRWGRPRRPRFCMTAGPQWVSSRWRTSGRGNGCSSLGPAADWASCSSSWLTVPAHASSALPGASASLTSPRT